MKIRPLMILGLIFYLLNVSAQAIAGRSVVVNDQQLNATEIQYLDQLSCSYIADGNYWLNTSTGLWGYKGGAAQGYISDNCNTRKPSLSERGLLYSPGELLR